MRILLLALCLLITGGCARMSTPTAPGQHTGSIDTRIVKEMTLNYLLYLPPDYDHSSDRKYPLMMFLHGVGERGTDVEIIKRHGPPKLIAAGQDFPFIIVSPQCPEDAYWPVDALIPLLDEIIAKYNVDEDRVYLTGLSMGGFGTWMLACDHPDRFAAIAPICGGGQTFRASNLKNVPVWAFHGAKDTVVPLFYSERMVESLEKAGGDVKLTVYPDATHDSWTRTYNNPELYDWFLQHRRKNAQD